MSKQLSGSLFVDIQGDNKQFKKSIQDSERQVQSFSNTVTQALGGNALLSALMGGGAVFGGVKAYQEGFKSFRAFKRMKRQSAVDADQAIIRRIFASGGLHDVKNRTLEEYQMDFDDPTATLSDKKSLEVDMREELRELRTDAAKAKLAARGGQGFLGHRGGMGFRAMQKLGMGRDMAQFAARGMANFMASGAGITLMGGAVAALAGVAINDMRGRSKESQVFNPDRIKEDAMTKVARIKQNIEIARSTVGEGFRGGAARFRDRQSARTSGLYGSVGNFFGGIWDTLMGIVHFNLQGGILGGAVRGLFGGSFI